MHWTPRCRRSCGGATPGRCARSPSACWKPSSGASGLRPMQRRSRGCARRCGAAMNGWNCGAKEYWLRRRERSPAFSSRPCKEPGMIRYPFTAVVDQQQLKMALVLCAIDPTIGGVLICGEKGTAKSTAARALADLLPPLQVRQGCPYHSAPDDPLPPGWTGESDFAWADAAAWPTVELPVPFVELPLGTTEDRLLGTIDLEVALRERRRAFQPGLFAAANRGILYVDEVNLLADHLVDLLLDAAASGVNVVQRESIEIVHPARFVLIGTMNPEEGQLRPQLLDRFGLMVAVSAPREPAARVQIVRRRAAFDADPETFRAAWQADEERLRRQIVAAKDCLAGVTVPEEMLQLICHICCEMPVDGLRADITMQKTARSLAAFHGRQAVAADDIREAAQWVLPHRRRRQPLEKPGLDPHWLDDLLPHSASAASDAREFNEG